MNVHALKVSNSLTRDRHPALRVWDSSSMSVFPRIVKQLVLCDNSWTSLASFCSAVIPGSGLNTGWWQLRVRATWEGSTGKLEWLFISSLITINHSRVLFHFLRPSWMRNLNDSQPQLNFLFHSRAFLFCPPHFHRSLPDLLHYSSLSAGPPPKRLVKAYLAFITPPSLPSSVPLTPTAPASLKPAVTTNVTNGFLWDK